MQDTALLEQLTGDIAMARQLCELTDEEFRFLGERDLVALEGILAGKQPLLALLGQHGAQRNKLLSSQNLPSSRAGLESLVSASGLRDEILAKSDELSQILDECQRANLRNGRLIRANQTAVKGMLGILRGNEAPGLYDSRGSASKSAYQRPLSQA
ncbi:flagella synthesis protein FlgN [Stutzerimonas azotifigens]|uniref:Flagellar protein FlgN n=1 Tax=Stutzerimonas azotifigens TaxID=291995 RepID=A0ABR5YXF0_9GAMM|nr:flagellar protein FlgN [Stutzerimonas azotifigens]MBA1272623.1 flagellar protein FlgN [Stutzerimonas azotifigens]